MKKFTVEEQRRWGDAMIATWHAIAADVDDGFRLEARLSGKKQRLTPGLLVEIVCDANRLEKFGGLTREEGNVISALYFTRRFQQWARRIMSDYVDTIEPPRRPRPVRKARAKAEQTYWERAGYTTYRGPSTPPIRIICK